MRQSSADLSRSAFALSVTSKIKRDSGSRKRTEDASRRNGNASKMIG